MCFSFEIMLLDGYLRSYCFDEGFSVCWLKPLLFVDALGIGLVLA